MKTKTMYLIGGLLSIFAKVALFIITLVFYLLSSGASAVPIINIICILASVILTGCCIAITMTTKNEKTAYAIVIPTVVVNMFLSYNYLSSNLQFLLYFIFQIFLVAGTIFYLLGLCASFREGDKSQPQDRDEMNEELQKLLKMKEDGVITDEEFDKLKMRIISKTLK